VLPARMVGASLRAAGVRQPLVVLLFDSGPVSAASRAALRADGLDVREVAAEGFLPAAPASAGPVKGWALPSGWHPKYLKLAAWRQTDFAEVAFVDADTRLHGSFAGLFDACRQARAGGGGEEEQGAVCGVVNPGMSGEMQAKLEAQGRVYLNGGVMVLRPSEARFQQLRGLIGTLGDNFFPVDQDFVNAAAHHLGWPVVPIAGNARVELHGSRDVWHYLGGKPWVWWVVPVPPPAVLQPPLNVTWGGFWDPEYQELRWRDASLRGAIDVTDAGFLIACAALAVGASCWVLGGCGGEGCLGRGSGCGRARQRPGALSSRGADAGAVYHHPHILQSVAGGASAGASAWLLAFWATVHRWRYSPSALVASSTQHPAVAFAILGLWTGGAAVLGAAAAAALFLVYHRFFRAALQARQARNLVAAVPAAILPGLSFFLRTLLALAPAALLVALLFLALWTLALFLAAAARAAGLLAVAPSWVAALLWALPNVLAGPLAGLVAVALLRVLFPSSAKTLPHHLPDDDDRDDLPR
jgi:hypothetical protein